MEELINKIKKYFLIINYDSNYDNDEIEETILLDQESHHSINSFKSVEFIECDNLINNPDEKNNIFWNNIIDFFKDIFKEKNKSI